MRASSLPDGLGAPSGGTFSLSTFYWMPYCKGRTANNHIKSTFDVFVHQAQFERRFNEKL